MAKKVAIISSVHDARDPRISIRIPLILKDEFDVFLLAGFNDSYASDESYRQEYENGFVWIPLLRMISPAERILRQSQIYSWIRENKPEIIWCNDPELLPLCFAIRKIQKTKVIFDLHEDVFDPGYPRKPFLRSVVSLGLENADLVVFAFERELRPYHPEAKVSAIELLNYYPSPLKKESKKPELRDSIFLFTGIVHKSRGLADYLEILTILSNKSPEIRGVIAGRCYEQSHLKWLKQEITKQKLDSKITLMGGKEYISWFTLQELQRTSLLGAMLYPKDFMNWQYPTKLYEYTVNQLHYIASDESSFRAFDEKYGGGFIYDSSNSDFRNQIEEWLVNKDSKFTNLEAPCWMNQKSNLLGKLAVL